MTRRPPGRSTSSMGLFWCLVCLAGGLLHAASLAWPTALWVPAGFIQGAPSGLLQVVALAMLVVALQFATRVGQSMWRSWVFAVAWLAGTFWWLFISMHTYGGLVPWLAAAAVLALAAALALYYAIAAAIVSAWAPVARAGQALLFAAAWTLAELARGQIFTGFPWGAAGYAHVDLMVAWAPLIGVYGMGFLAALLAYALGSLVTAGVQGVLAWLRRPVRAVPARGPGGVYVNTATPRARARGAHAWLLDGLTWGVLAALVASLLAREQWRDWGQVQTRGTGALSVWLLQGNIAQDQKFQPGTGVAQALQWYPARVHEAIASAQAGQGPQLVIAPETALPLLPAQLGPSFWQPLLQALAEQTGPAPVAWLSGLPLGSLESGYTNSAWGITPLAARQSMDNPDPAALHRYDKHHLVPFGEFIPPLFRWFTQMMNIPLGDFARGPLPQPPWAWAGQRIAPNICYEDLFGEEIAASFADAQNAPSVLVNLSNIAWFGDSVAIDQHLQISRLRALEFGRPMLRATNTGATAVIDHRGVVTQALPRLERGRLEASVQGRAGLTPYARWVSRWGLMPLWAACALLILAIATARMRRRRPGGR